MRLSLRPTQWAPPVRVLAWIGLCLSGLLLVWAVARGLPGANEAKGLLGPVFLFLGAQPFVLLFLSVTAGYGLSRVRFIRTYFGATAATLLVALGLSVWASLRSVVFAIPEFASTMMFNLFMFAVGMKVGPQFLSGLRRDARAFVSIALLVPLISIGLMLGVRAVFDLQPGIAAGIFAGANTATPGLGAARDVYLAEFGPDSQAAANLSAAFAFSFSLSLVLFVVLMKGLPKRFGKDVVQEAREYQQKLERGAVHALPGTAEALETGVEALVLRAFEVQGDALIGVTRKELRERLPGLAVERLRRAGKLLDPSDELRFERGDVLALSGAHPAMIRAEKVVGPEIPDPSLLAVNLETIEVVAKSKRAAGKTVGELMETAGRGFALNALFRGGEEIPFGDETVCRPGDVFRLTGSARSIGRFEAVAGRLVRPSTATDMATLALGLSLGALVGALPIPLFGLRLALGSAVGLLAVGIVLSTLRTRNPTLGGPFPEAARRLLEDLGLNVFIAITGLNAGAGIIAAVKAGTIVPIIVGTLVVGSVPPVLGWAFGQYRHKMNAALLTGAVAGARSSSPGLRIAQEDTRSTVPALSYPVTFAISSVVLTLASYLLATLD